MEKAHVIVIGAGFTGVAVAYDLAKRGLSVTVMERGPIANGTSGRTHGLLHSGARYAVDDQESAIECIDENLILRKIAAQVIELNGGAEHAPELPDGHLHLRQRRQAQEQQGGSDARQHPGHVTRIDAASWPEVVPESRFSPAPPSIPARSAGSPRRSDGARLRSDWPKAAYLLKALPGSNRRRQIRGSTPESAARSSSR